ncbi:MAG: TM0106 family RecB-like putative nuclease, partial [Longimicrobiales bacterium]
MHHATTLIFSATDLSGFLACPQLTLLERANALGQAKRPVYDDPSAEVLRKRGLEHEARWLDGRRRDGAGIVEIGGIDYAADRRAEWERAAAETLAAMRAGTEIIYQGVLFDGTWLGRPDFLERVDTPSALGDWSYEVVDAKLAREAKGGALLQLMLYADLLEHAQGQAPERVHLELGGPNARRESFRTADYAAYFRRVRERFLAWVDAASAVLPCAPEPVEHCAICAWGERCKRERRDADHLSLVAGITAQQRQVLTGRGTTTLAALARLDRSVSLRRDGVSDVALKRIREQARIQLEGRERDAHLHELLEPVSEPERGLCALPAPSPGDVFFDLEGDPFALGDGLEYLWGFTPRQGEYTASRALDRDAEKAAFERFIDLVVARLEHWPGLHVYHFGVYETTALKKLSGRYATREDALDRLLRGRVFVDLHRVVRQALRASVESYSIKKLEPLYAFERDVGLRDASGALAHFEAWLELGGGEGEGEGLLAIIERYNRDDCVSTLRLAQWLEGLRGEVEAERGECLPRPSPGDPEPPGALGEELDETARLVGLLTEGVPADADDREPEPHARWLLAQLLDYHRREDKSFWWEYFRCIDLDELEAVEDGATLGGLEYERVVDTVKRSEIHRYTFPPQDHGIKVGKDVRDRPRERAAKEAQRAGDVDARAASPGTVVALDDHARTIDLKRGKGSKVPHPSVLVPFEYVNPDPMPESLRRLAVAVLAHGFTDANPHRA